MSTTRQTHLPTYDHRPGTGPTLVFLHYWGGSARTWDLVVDRLAGRDVLTVDFRGWSRSRGLPGPYSLGRLADDTLAVLVDARVTEYVLVGHSMGGKVAQLVAATRPAGLRGIVLVGSGPAKPAAQVTPEYQEALSHAYDSAESVAGARDHVLTATELPAPVKARIVTDSRTVTDGARTEWPLRGIAQDITEHTRLVGVPALVVAGEHDQVEPVHVLRDNLLPYLCQADFVVVPRTGHLIPLEAPAELADAIAAFGPAQRPSARPDGLCP
ncbi:alpha/beta hydrolase [Streptomyces maremycinicus]|nr:alpha/beta hydrolase [Streptomyces sp. B9173]